MRAVVVELSRQLGVPLCHFSNRVRYCGNFYGQTKTREALPQPSASRGCVPADHPAARAHRIRLPSGVADDVDSIYRAERSVEVQILCDPRICAVLTTEKIQLGSFHADERLSDLGT